jgi:hypothetical protein
MTTTPSIAITPRSDAPKPRTRALLVTVMRAAEILSLSEPILDPPTHLDRTADANPHRQKCRFSIDHLEAFVADRIADSQQ